MVASKRSEFSSSLLILESDGCFRDSISFLSDGESEKKAISEADAKPDASNSTPARMMAVISDTVGGFTVMWLKKSANRRK